MLFSFKDDSNDKLELEKIHQTSVRILSELGVQIDHQEMKELLAGLGCRISGQRAYFPPELVARTVKSIPRSFRLYGRNDYSGVLVDADGPSLFTNTGILPNIYDFDSGIIRQSVRSDVEITTRMLDAFKEIDIVYVSLMDATEMAPHLVTVTDFAATIANTTKPLAGPGAINGDEAKAIISMSLALRNDDRQALATRPPCAPFVVAITPLIFTKEAVDAIIEIAKAGLPLTAITNPVMGATSPYSIAGTVALGHAEELAIAVMAHAIYPGLPILSFNTPTVADMRTIASTNGGPETGLLRSLIIRLDRHLGIPSWAHGDNSSARMDEQASDEKSINTMLIACARPSMLGGLGGLANVTLSSYETLVMDNERFGAIRRVLQETLVDDEHLAYEVITDQVKGQTVITHNHTLKNLRSKEVWLPKLANRIGLVSNKRESFSMLEKARTETKYIMENHIVEPLSESILGRLEEIVVDYDQKHRSNK